MEAVFKKLRLKPSHIRLHRQASSPSGSFCGVCALLNSMAEREVPVLFCQRTIMCVQFVRAAVVER